MESGMSVPRLSSADLYEIARRACTKKQLEVIRLRETGLGWKAIGLVLGIGPDTVRDHYRRAVLNVTKEADRVKAAGSDSAGEAAQGARSPGRDSAT